MMKQIDSNELKKIQLEILDFVDGFCNHHEIKYFLTGGTLIGAIRHKGYIPWDDDIDICMLRSDYDRFIELLSKENDSTYKVFSHILYKDYPFPYAKVANCKTILFEDIISQYDIGVNIDVFPLDTIPVDVNLQKKLYNKFNLYYGMLQMKQIKWRHGRFFYKNIFVLLSRYVLKIIPCSFIVKQLHLNATQYKGLDSPLCGDVVWGYGIKEITRMEYFENSILAVFEGKKYSIPKGYDLFLRSLYGDYMRLPPSEERLTHHNFKAFWR